MAFWLFKEEPTHYSLSDLERDGEMAWTGVTNALARRNLSKVRRGDRIWYYHTGKEKAIVGEAKASSDAEPDATAKDGKGFMVRLIPVRRLARPVTLAELKQQEDLQTWELIRLPRLSVLPVSSSQWQRIESIAKQKA